MKNKRQKENTDVFIIFGCAQGTLPDPVVCTSLTLESSRMLSQLKNNDIGSKGQTDEKSSELRMENLGENSRSATQQHALCCIGGALQKSTNGVSQTQRTFLLKGSWSLFCKILRSSLPATQNLNTVFAVDTIICIQLDNCFLVAQQCYLWRLQFRREKAINHITNVRTRTRPIAVSNNCYKGTELFLFQIKKLLC